ncbi:RhoGEF domain-containing protein [Reticulomyxa filosa]|uniref:RhoGEF domain-containing protein n=1 Tax=Reticulomyxa filosa TaxID=46433 RepID=X6NB48_RETFI|nr:RhoGEF domain-containing protein [Reticulomyxa filosa]|eukprot:ETO23510.1 RhoGEF domain-containing protein [Reticulomyxa filosa]
MSLASDQSTVNIEKSVGLPPPEEESPGPCEAETTVAPKARECLHKSTIVLEDDAGEKRADVDRDNRSSDNNNDNSNNNNDNGNSNSNSNDNNNNGNIAANSSSPPQELGSMMSSFPSQVSESSGLPPPQSWNDSEGTVLTNDLDFVSAPILVPQPQSTTTPEAPQDVAAIDSEKEKRARNRMRAIAELVETEQKYVLQLRELIDNWMRPLQEQQLISEVELKRIFPGDIVTIEKFNRVFLCNLEHIWRDFDNEISFLGPEISSFIPYFKMYQNYLNNHPRASQTIQQLTLTNSKFKEFLFTKCQQSSRKLPLESYLILPIQRIPRYELLLDQILKNTEPSHLDWTNLQKALENIRKENKIANDRIKDFECRQMVRQIEHRLLKKRPWLHLQGFFFLYTYT